MTVMDNTRPRTWEFTDVDTGQTRTITCTPWCNISHASDIAHPCLPSEISCISYDRANTAALPVACGHDAEDVYVMSALIEVDHFDPDPARRAPHAIVEIVQDHFTGALDPDGLQALIGLFEQRVAALRIRHAELVTARAEHQPQKEAQA
ncbi:DUF6907 domain-containing protein [Streptomyces spectabilis]|uniref:Uncharacterized protein n=1 Tax=Streptomyces spectabilis TaxID=68270 RepID=A0A5P2X5Q4_STRST|nr:hypothetical protein [Streptomyces spectabilis]MBB5103251.1 hypothetical protein [Streptomyces spectabilis]MCI3902443.1 hypothetical protein [Streptomyces spectabilis]QEV59788.1 hypothetical protein CP982_14450 [Streptomyces spectabilis]GGV13856.1 hypothetical protein GCM10010245_24130 [Streptomyces spectabilis]